MRAGGTEEKALFGGKRGPGGKSVAWRKAVDAKCRDCIYDPQSGLGTWRQQTEACTITDCPLWPIRPISKPEPHRVRR